MNIDDSDVYALIVSAILLQTGWRLWTALPPHWLPGLAIATTYATAVAVVVAAVAGVDWEEHGRAVAVWVGWVFIVDAILYLLVTQGGFGSDAQLFVAFGVRRFVEAGANPFTLDMAAAQQIATDTVHYTPRTDGSTVARMSYPAGMVWAFVPQTVLGLFDGLRSTIVAFTAGVAALLVYASPRRLALVPFILFALPRNLWLAGLGGLPDIVWLLPLLAALYWWDDRPVLSSVAIGVSMACKQFAWLIAPFLAIDVWRDSDDAREFVDRAARHLVYAGVPFILLQLPFVLWDPGAWLSGVLTPAGAASAELIHQGVGLSVLSTVGTLTLTKTAHSLLMLTVFGAALAAYYYWWPRSRWIAWVIPPVILWFSYRSLNSYFAFFIPVAYLALLRHQAGDDW